MNRRSSRDILIVQPYFSLKGYQESAQHFMFAHGINYFSYENSEIMDHLDKNIKSVLTQIRFHKLNSKEFKNFKDLSSMQNLSSEMKKEGYDKSLGRLVSYLGSVLSYVGVLDKRFPIHILTQKKIIPKKPGTVKLEFLQKNSFILKTTSNRQIGQFSLTSMFVSQYVKMAKRYNISDNIFRQIDVIVLTKRIYWFQISENLMRNREV